MADPVTGTLALLAGSEAAAAGGTIAGSSLAGALGGAAGAAAGGEAAAAGLSGWQALTLAGGGLSAAGQVASGIAAKDAADFKAKQEMQAAMESRAAAQRSAFERQREAAFASSSLQARAAAGGGDADGPTIIKLGEDIAGRGEYLALSDMYRGENRARGLEDQAGADRISGSAARDGAMLSAAGTLIGSAGSMYKLYGMSDNPYYRGGYYRAAGKFG